MRKHQIEQAAYEVATQIRTVEDVIDGALAEIAELQARMVRARSTAGVGIATGHAALEQLGAALQGLIAARGGMANCHAELVGAKSLVPGLRTVSFGDAEECPPPSARTTLRAVA
jgi:hypothetical protein